MLFEATQELYKYDKNNCEYIYIYTSTNAWDMSGWDSPEFDNYELKEQSWNKKFY